MPIGAVGAIAGVAGGIVGGNQGGNAFEAALNNALGGNNVNDQLNQMIAQGAVGIMGPMMMRIAGDVLGEGMSDD